jgi:NADH:ubiquinone oxidoreductase subunit 3 (subunit A)
MPSRRDLENEYLEILLLFLLFSIETPIVLFIISSPTVIQNELGHRIYYP